MLRRLLAALVQASLLSAAVAGLPRLTADAGLDLAGVPWSFTPGPGGGHAYEGPLAGPRPSEAVTLPGTIHSDTAEGTLRLTVEIAEPPRAMRGLLSTELLIGDIRGSDRTFFNGEEIGATSGMAISESGIPRRYTVPSRLIRFGGANEIEIRVRGLGGAQDIAIGGPLTLAALGPHELWGQAEALRAGLQRSAQTIWGAETEALVTPREAKRIWNRHRRAVERVAGAEAMLARGRLSRASTRLGQAQDLLRGLEAQVGPLRLALEDREESRRTSLVAAFTQTLSSEERRRGVEVRARRESFGRFGLWLADGTDFLERVSPVEIRGRGEMGWRIAVDDLLAAQVADINWVSKTTLVVGQRGGRPCDYTLSASLPFPGVFLEQRAGRSVVFELEAPPAAIGLRALSVTADGVRPMPLALGRSGARVPALLVARRADRETLWMTVVGSPLSEVELEAAGPDRSRLTLTWPWGVSRRLTLIPVSGVALQSTQWLGQQGALPSDVAAACAALAALARQIPRRIEEFYAVDPEAGRVTLFDQVLPIPLDPGAARPPRFPVWLPPLALFCAAEGQAVTVNWGERLDLPLESFQGPVAVDMQPHGQTVWSIPLPSVDGRFHVRPAEESALVTLLNDHLNDLGTPQMPNAVDRTYKTRAQAHHAWAMLSDENRQRVSTNGRTMIPLTFDYDIWHPWEEPFSGLRTWYTYTIEGPAFDLYDQEWGCGLGLYALALHAMVEGDWDLMRSNRDWLDLMWTWWQVTDDWGWLRSSNGFHGHGTGAGDCSCANYAGVLGRARLMEGIGDIAARDEALYLLARAALMLTARFPLTDWARGRGLIAATEIPVGFHEGEGYLTGDVTDYPWTATSMISGNGIQPEVIDLLLERVPEHLRRYEEEMLRAHPNLFEGDHDYGRPTLYRGNSGYITLPHLYVQARLGTSEEQVRQWLRSAQTNDHLWWLAPTVLAEMAGRPTDFWLLRWTPARLDGAQAAPDGSVQVRFTATHSPFRWSAHAGRRPSRVLINDFEIGQWSWDETAQRLTVETDLTGQLDFEVEFP